MIEQALAFGYHVDCCGLSHPGRKRENNEDSVGYFAPVELADIRSSGDLYLVADGVGGAAKGEKASLFAVEKVLHDYFQSPTVEPGERLRKALRQAGNEIYDYAEFRSDQGPMATTMVAAVVFGRQLIVASVGDSRAYLIRGGVARQITEDHTDPGRRNRLIRSLGGERDVEVDIFDDVTLKPGDKVLLCSDGLTRYAHSAEISELSVEGSAEQIVKRLIDFANAAGGADNITALLIVVGQPATLEEIHTERVKLPHSLGSQAVQEGRTMRWEARPAARPGPSWKTPATDPLAASNRLHVMVFIAVSVCVVLTGLSIWGVWGFWNRQMVNLAAGRTATQIALVQQQVGTVQEKDRQTATQEFLDTQNTQAAEATLNQQGTAIAAQMGTADLQTANAITNLTQLAASASATDSYLETRAALATDTPIPTVSPTPTIMQMGLVQECLRRIGGDIYLATLLLHFNLQYDPRQDYYYYESCMENNSVYMNCGMKQLILDKNHIPGSWIIVIPIVPFDQNACYAGGGSVYTVP